VEKKTVKNMRERAKGRFAMGPCIDASKESGRITPTAMRDMEEEMGTMRSI